MCEYMFLFLVRMCVVVVGDKTRMDQLSKSDDCYVRASPTRGVLGGIAEHTADVITLCEAGAMHH
jgi:LAO/AO transport system kinase